MHFSPISIVLYSSVSIAAVLEQRQAFECSQDNCLRAVNGTNRGPSHPVTALGHCRDYMTTTVAVDPFLATTTKTDTSTITVFPPCPNIPSATSILGFRAPLAARLPEREVKAREVITTAIAITHGSVPYYATEFCTLEHYSSACRCIGATPGLVTSTSITVTLTTTTTVVDTLIGPCTPIFPPEPSPPSLTTSDTRTTTTYTITMSNNSTTSSTTVVVSDPSSGTGSGTGTGTGTFSTGTSRSTTSCTTSSYSSPAPPFTNSTTSSSDNSTMSIPEPSTSFNLTTSTFVPDPSTTSNFTTSTLPTKPSTTSNHTTSTFVPTNSTLPPTSTPTPPVCGGRGVLACNGTCIDTTNDVQHCGSCNNACAEGFFCTNGVCTRTQCDSDCNFSRLCGPSNENVTCACALDTSNAGVCYNRMIDCDAAFPPRCKQTKDCEVGSVCVPSACCGVGRCVNTKGCDPSGGAALGLMVSFGMENNRIVRRGFA